MSPFFSRTIDAIHLNPVEKCQGGHTIWNIATNKEFFCVKVNQMPITDLAMQAVGEKAEKEDHAIADQKMPHTKCHVQ